MKLWHFEDLSAAVLVQTKWRLATLRLQERPSVLVNLEALRKQRPTQSTVSMAWMGLMIENPDFRNTL